MRGSACLLLFTKPARPGRVKTRLVGTRVAGRAIGPADAARLHEALLGDLCERLADVVEGDLRLRVTWDLEAEDAIPPLPPQLAGRPGVDATRQHGRDLGERLFRALDEAARGHEVVAAVGSDHPTLDLEVVRRGFSRLACGEADVALGPSLDGGYSLVAVRRGALSPRLFAEIDWSTERVYAQTRERCRELGLRVDELTAARDVDRVEDVLALAREIAAMEAAGDTVPCPRTRVVLAGWGLLAAAPPGAVTVAAAEERRGACAS